MTPLKAHLCTIALISAVMGLGTFAYYFTGAFIILMGVLFLVGIYLTIWAEFLEP